MRHSPYLLLPFLLFSLLAAPGPARAFEIKNCGPQATDGVRMAAGFITRHMSTIVDSYTFLSAKQRQEIVVKWPNLKLECEDQVPICRGGAFGYAHGGPGNRINICYRNMVDAGERVCDLVRTIMHESGHAHGFRSTHGHNEANSFVRQNDSMYRMGDTARDHCLAIRPTNDLLPGTVRTALGGTCDKNKECQSSFCEKGVCACNDDSDCPSATLPVCHKRASKANFCGREDKAVGERCSVNDQCRSDRCQNDVCVCTENRHCTSADRPICHKQTFKPNFCGSSRKKVGQTCQKDDQCASDACQYGRCACKSNADCPDEGIRTCHKRTLRWNFCGATDKPIGTSCSVDAQCASNKCKSDRCVAR